jgi:hypothetical protein
MKPRMKPRMKLLFERWPRAARLRDRLGGTAQRMGMRSCLIAALLVVSSASAASAQTKPGPKPGTKAAAKAAKKDEAAQAEYEARPKLITVALLGGYGYALEAPSDVNPFGAGFGVRGGYNLDAFYLGARFMIFLGDSEQIEGVEVSANSITIGLEAGYDIGLFDDFLVVRPELGFGLFSASIEAMAVSGGSQVPIDESSEDLYIAPGLALLMRISDRVFVGVDGQLPIIFDDDIVVETTVLLTAGMSF